MNPPSLERPKLPGLDVAAGLWCLAVFAQRFLMLSTSPWASGLDGYAYAVQILAISSRGQPMMVDDSPLIWLLGAFNLFVHDPVLVTKYCAALFGAGLTLAVRFFVLRCGGSGRQALAAAILTGLSPTLAFLSIDYVKNLGALALFFAAAGWILVLSGAGAKRPGQWLAGLACIILALVSHRVMTVMTLAFAVASLGPALVGRLRGQNWRRVALVAGGGLLVLAAAALAIAMVRGGLNLADLGRLSPQFHPSLSLPGMSEAFRVSLPAAVWLELSLLVLVPLLLVPALRGQATGFRALWLVALGLFLPLWDQTSLDLSFRLLGNGAPLAWVLLVLVLPAVPRQAWRWGFAAALAALPLDRAVYMIQAQPNYRLWDRVSQAVALPGDSLLIAHAGLNHYYTYTHRLAEAINWIPEFPVAIERLWRISHGVDLAEFRALVPDALGDGLVQGLAGPYCLVREDVWRRFLEAAGAQRRQDLQDWFNPWQERPAFLAAKNQS